MEMKAGERKQEDPDLREQCRDGYPHVTHWPAHSDTDA